MPEEPAERDMQRYVRSVARAIVSGDVHRADDLEQEVLLVALTARLKKGRRGRPWLRAVTKNTLRYTRAQAACRPLESTSRGERLQTIVSQELDPAVAVVRKELTIRLGRMLARLPSTCRDVVRMRAIDGLPPRVVAEELCVPVETVRTRYRRGLELLREAAQRLIEDDALSVWEQQDER